MNKYTILGMMSGTSLDGLDLVLTELQEKQGSWTFRILRASCVDYDPEMRLRLQQSIGLSAPELLAFHKSYGRWLGQQASAFLGGQLRLDAIASHGHTVHHRPEQGFTFQLGCPQELALHSGIRTIGDFRSLDISLGGQGAPLVPAGDRLLFGSYDFCLNLGGISNVSFEKDGQRIAFDIGIANMLLNHLSGLQGLDYDKGGKLAEQGSVNTALLQALDALPYYELPYPKSTGYEWFRDAILPVLAVHPDSVANQLRTAVAHISGQVARQLGSLSPDGKGTVLVTGGGALNTFLMDQLKKDCGTGIELKIPNAKLIAFKEALVFALLGALRLEGSVNVLASVTGASRDSCSGIVIEPL